ncbi:MAG TPA: DUF6624 domain-containing protein [Thermoanaerobaculia bacterium]|jgi:hypothetical protein|nr:DUF6624 domain-containing protein [Thermoanaerobaculia bacterium]
MKALRVTRWFVLAVLTAGAPVSAISPPRTEAPCTGKEEPVQGAWEKPGGATEVLFKKDEIIIWKGGALSVARILAREPCKLQVRYQGLRSTWTLTRDHDIVQLKADEPLTLKSLPNIPGELDLTTRVLPPEAPVSTDEVKEVEKELVRRGAMDQDALKNPALKAKWPAIMADNLQYLRDLTRRVGWIDIPRFGKRSAAAAILIAKHGQDLVLMKSALPIVERDVKKNGGSGEMFSVLYDGLQVTLGNKQRYGTQIAEDEKGRPFIMPLEDPSRVDAYRKEIGILSFKEYLKLASDNMGGVTLRVAGDDE